MDQASASPNVHFHDAYPAPTDSHPELLRGLRQAPKRIDPKWFYDARGSALFEQITQLPEYYPTRAEIAILSAHRDAIAERIGNGCVFIEPGSGNCAKAKLLLDALQPSAYVPLDISANFLRDAALQLGAQYPWLAVQAICADFNCEWTWLDRLPPGRRVVFYPGSTIGNLEPAAAGRFLARVRKLVGTDGGMLVGVDLHKPSARINAAYNDAQGVTARFNLNILEHINAQLGTRFDTTRFSHRAFYNSEQRRIEMHLVSDEAQTVKCNGETIVFEHGETIHTENSYKYSVEDFAALAATAGLQLQQSWFDAEQLFSVHYLEAD
ncbi:MAG: L-histidine N(alpha)-methyltransferase [Halioglobus sp.]|nr:L-histidine N(alpha)-methyltransferase [Halioglobus sp.]|tara:strand:+ start:521 stop:1492 length:972 start_codon:yes stop_codon:yes gene_type:complete